MKILVVGDPHFKVDNREETDILHREVLFNLQKHHPDFLVILGDTLDRHETIHVSPLTRAVNFIKDCSKLTKTFLLIGNHDVKNNKQIFSDEHPFVAFEGFPNITVVKNVVTYQDFLFCPYLPTGLFNDYVKPEDHIKIIFCHQEFYQAEINKDIFSKDGDRWDRKKLIISGHVHKRQISEYIWYIGTPFQHNFGEDPDKSISLIDVGEKITEERIFLSIPKKITLELNYQEFRELDYTGQEDLRVIVTGNKQELSTIKKSEKIKIITNEISEKNTDKKHLPFSLLLKGKLEKENLLAKYQEITRK